MKFGRLADVDLTPLLQRAAEVPADVEAAVEAIFMHMQDPRGLRELTRRFDGADLPIPILSEEDWEASAQACPQEIQEVLRENHARIVRFHEMQVPTASTIEMQSGLRLGRKPVPLASAGCYVPGGRASYPSTVLMTVTPARLAGVQRIVVVTPPRRDGTIDPAVAYAAKLAGATQILRAGGAQAIAAMAFGASGFDPVRAIVGPGNAYVTAAKQRVAGMVVTDPPAGPSELLVLADATANAHNIALDLIAQAEHDPDARVVLVTTDEDLGVAVQKTVATLAADADRAEVLEASLPHGMILLAQDMDEAVDFVNAYAAEHVSIQTADPHALLARIENAGSVFLGQQTPVSLGDYGSGTNHVLPTMGYALLRGGLSVEDFIKWITWQEADQEARKALTPSIAAFARAEGLTNHARAMEERQ